MSEEWRVIEENSKYQISNLGNVRGPRGLRKPTPINKHGHLAVCWWIDKKLYQRYIHRLVLQAFVGPCPESQEVLHKDDDPTNNHLDNLEYGTHRRNMETRNRFTDDEIFFIRMGQHYQWEYADHFKVNISTIEKIVQRRTYSHL